MALSWLLDPNQRRSKPARRECRPNAYLRRFWPHLEGLEDQLLLDATVDTLSDVPEQGKTTLRQALAIGGKIDFKAGLTGTIKLTAGELMVQKDVTIMGPGAGVITVSGNGASRVLEIFATFTAHISGLTISHGRANDGGGILNRGTLDLSAVAVIADTATNNGGESRTRARSPR
jgi:hypothetical protein